MCGVTENAKLFGSLLKRRKLLEELFFGQLLRRETAFVPVVGVDEVLHAITPVAGAIITYRVYTLHRKSSSLWADFTSCVSIFVCRYRAISRRDNGGVTPSE